MKQCTATIAALSVSTRKGTQKSNVREVTLVEDWGIDGDAHAGAWHRQVSLLAIESIDTIRAKGLTVEPGAFAENITTQGIDLTALAVGDRLLAGGTELQITQKGKECHTRCAIYQQAGDCVMPREGIFARVIRGGRLLVGDPLIPVGGGNESSASPPGNKGMQARQTAEGSYAIG